MKDFMGKIRRSGCLDMLFLTLGAREGYREIQGFCSISVGSQYSYPHEVPQSLLGVVMTLTLGLLTTSETRSNSPESRRKAKSCPASAWGKGHNLHHIRNNSHIHSLERECFQT